MAAPALVEPVLDTSRRFHKLKVKTEVFEIDVRYTDLAYIASGAYGYVCSAVDTVSGRKVAIKKVKDVFRNLTDAKRILRELKLLRHLGGHENIIWILDIMVSPYQRDFKDLYIVTDLMETDLGRIIDSSQTLSDAHIKYFMYQMLRAMKYTHSAKILHRDLKPQNILVNSSCELVVCDFGLARCTSTGADGALDETGEPTEAPADGAGLAALTVYVVTRWYRAPELLLGSASYGEPVDIWSIGCILAEILGRKPLFRGSNYMHQLQVIVEVLGSPTEHDMRMVVRKSAKDAIERMGKREKVPLNRLFPRANPLAIDLLEKMLVFDPDRRITATEALAHPYLADYHYPDDEPTAPRMVDLDFEKQAKMSKQELQMRMIREMQFFHPASDAAPTPSARISETAAKNEVAKNIIPAAAVAAPTAAVASGAGSDSKIIEDTPADAGGEGAVEGSLEEIQMSRTAKNDLEFEKARKEAQRLAQQHRGASALAALGAGPSGSAPAPAPAPVPTATATASGKPPHHRGGSTSSFAMSSDDDSDLDHGIKLNSDVIAAISAQVSKLETRLTETLMSRIASVIAPLEARIARLEASSKPR